jgi:hypothetical protein
MSVVSFARPGGDLGGGLLKAIALNKRQIQILKSMHTEDEAFQEWVDSLDDKKRAKIFEKVFEHLVLPKLEE